MRKNSTLIALSLMIVTLVSISCEKDFDEIEMNPNIPEDTTSVINPIDTSLIDTTPVITIVPKVFVPARKLTIGSSFALVGYTNGAAFKSATDGGHDNGNGKSEGHAYGLYKLKMKNGIPVMDSIYTTGENDSLSVGNEIYVSSILDLNNGHVLLKGSFKFALDTLGNTKTKHDLIVKKSDGYIVNFDDNDEEYEIDKHFYNEKIRVLNNGNVLYSQFDGDYFYIKKLVIGENDVTSEDITTDRAMYFNVDKNDNILYCHPTTNEIKVIHSNTGNVEFVANRETFGMADSIMIDFYVNELKEIFFVCLKGNPMDNQYFIYKLNITSDSYNFELVNTFHNEHGFEYLNFQNSGSNLVYNLSKDNYTTFITYDRVNSTIVWANATNGTSDKKMLIDRNLIIEKIITINSDEYVYMTVNSSVLKVSISTGDKVENYFYNSDYTINSISTSADDYLTVTTIRNSDNASVVWSVSPNGSAEILSETANNIVTSVENIE